MSNSTEDRIAKAINTWGYSIKRWYDSEDGKTAVLDGDFRILDHDTLDEGDEGWVEAMIVGAPAHGNVRVAYWFITHGWDRDSGEEITLDQVEPC